MRQANFNKYPAVRGPYQQKMKPLDDYTSFEDILVVLAFAFGLAALGWFYALDDLCGSSKVVGVPFNAKPGVRYELTPPHIQRQLKEFLYAL